MVTTFFLLKLVYKADDFINLVWITYLWGIILAGRTV